MRDMHVQSDQYRRHALHALSAYWGCGAQYITELPLAGGPEFSPECTRPDFTLVTLPEWAQDIAADGGLLVPTDCIQDGVEAVWQRADWLLAAFHLLECSAEREFEERHGPIHSYSFRLHGWDTRVWSRAWVNRIALFLRRWAARQYGCDEMTLFGPRPQTRIILTHDVDAISKTMPIRLKQGAFNIWKSALSVVHGDVCMALRHLGTALRFLFSGAQYDYLDSVAALVSEHKLESTFNFFAGKTDTNWLFDPGYDIERPDIQSKLRRLTSLGFGVGLHQSFRAFEDADRMRAERNRLERLSGTIVSSCRQHWLRFSWEKTWEAQSKAGLKFDATLGFNDRPGFRAASALRWQPWSGIRQEQNAIEAVPLLFMDSHFYDYRSLEGSVRREQMSHWLEEVHAVGGVASVLWHPHSLSSDYGWREGFVELLERLGRMK